MSLTMTCKLINYLKLFINLFLYLPSNAMLWRDGYERIKIFAATLMAEINSELYVEK